ncbi:heavy-metal-associated domain-containing protein [Svornostia abyssi]|uniref:Heavy-metal-associated domain-containing protein n=1 Tax=Svornostia abyssi TaxID=2898438 RepID=A0ABY5PC06_9ACTN|nr:heavy-metal-associated domain-containing protein [Parviterribacteraceae bacterium J379]
MSGLPTLPMAGADAQTAPPVVGVDARRFRVEGMDCASCARTVEKVVGGLDGVVAVQVSFGNATLLVDGEVPTDAVKAAVRRVGYTAHEAGARSGAPVPFWRRGPRALSTTVSVVLLLAAAAASLLDAPRAVSESLYLASMAAGGGRSPTRR